MHIHIYDLKITSMFMSMCMYKYLDVSIFVKDESRLVASFTVGLDELHLQVKKKNLRKKKWLDTRILREFFPHKRNDWHL